MLEGVNHEEDPTKDEHRTHLRREKLPQLPLLKPGKPAKGAHQEGRVLTHNRLLN